MEKEFNIEEVKGQQPKEAEGQFIILIGNPGAGKTTFASKFPKPLLVDLEGTASNIPNLKRIRIIPELGIEGSRTEDELEKIKDKRDLPIKDLGVVKEQFLKSNNYETLILDGGLELILIAQDFILKSLGRNSMSEHTYGDTYKKSRDLLERFFKKSIGRGKNIILICHIEENILVDKETDEEYTQERPMLDDKKMIKKLPALANIVGKVEVNSKGERVFDCIPGKRSVFKNQFGINEVMPATYEALNTKIKEYFKEAK